MGKSIKNHCISCPSARRCPLKKCGIDFASKVCSRFINAIERDNKVSSFKKLSIEPELLDPFIFDYYNAN